MVSYDNLPKDPLARSTELDRRIEVEISKMIARRRIMKRWAVGLITVLVIALGWFLQSRLARDTVSAQEIITKAIALRDQGRLSEAVQTLHDALQIDPSRLGARRLLGELSLALGDPSEARKQFRVASPDGRSIVVQLGLFRADLLQGKFADVASRAKVALEHTRNEDLELIMIQGLVGSGEIDAGREALDALISRYPKHQSALRTSIRVHLVQGNIAKAQTQFDQLSQSHNQVETALLEAEIEFARGKPASAAVLLTKVSTRFPGHPEAMIDLIRANLEAEEFELVDAELTRLEAFTDRSVTTAHLRAYYYWRRGDTDAAEKAARDLLGHTPKHIDTRILLASLAADAKRYEEALTLLAGLDSTRDDQVSRILSEHALSVDDSAKAISILENRKKALKGWLPETLRELLVGAYRAAEQPEKAQALEQDSLNAQATHKRPALLRCNVVAYRCEICEYVRSCY
ncbi:MAG: Tfp pilus assembly protein PilF [Gammaproteobacteria bacterium]|jgi:Tfp pilus assembly protein PilF